MNVRHRARAVRHVLAAVVLLIVVAPRPSQATACDDWLRQTRPLTGSYVPVRELYARAFVFAMLVDCKGSREVVTVQRATGTLPVCEPRQPVEVVGKLVWNKTLVEGHYEITDPSSVTCRSAALQATNVPAPSVGPEATNASTTSIAAKAASESTPHDSRLLVPPAPAQPPRTQARVIGPSVWVGRYQDSRGVGDVTFTLLRGESTVSGTWKLRTGGGGPITGVLEAGGHRMQFRMENIAPECPGMLEGSSDITETTLVAIYRGKDCEGSVTDGRLELRVQ